MGELAIWLRSCNLASFKNSFHGSCLGFSGIVDCIKMLDLGHRLPPLYITNIFRVGRTE